MKIPPYVECEPAELARIMRWAQRKLSLRDWTLTFTTDIARAKAASMTGIYEDFGGVIHDATTMVAMIAVNLVGCAKPDITGTRDPRWIVLHEVAHLLAAATAKDLDPDEHHYMDWERLANRIARVLFDLWLAEEGGL